jgi:hypothetical protein
MRLLRLAGHRPSAVRIGVGGARRQGGPEGLAPTIAARRHPLAEAGSTACVAGRCVSIGVASRASECPNPLRTAAARSEHAWAVDGRRGVFLAQRRECLNLRGRLFLDPVTSVRTTPS